MNKEDHTDRPALESPTASGTICGGAHKAAFGDELGTHLGTYLGAHLGQELTSLVLFCV
ncbi:hypothetical protein GCM10025760_28230 [Microbacterium yannicii]|uniref:Uncharacterized protein n=1 Tax=Microbacterium yannicii TaxID=671622 RepID=A0ABP9MF22_9MICO